ncbi:hypothetical protein E3N88_36916 [Mikania micrantha]|uniref:Uncharacterized protein n=1 Tax=Mikania micrantha TaxID=192012 RepID=A0A5N6M644_9ASTR|nr:hypothetical protein E3N88_36916 [Mikania micrantha]
MTTAGMNIITEEEEDNHRCLMKHALLALAENSKMEMRTSPLANEDGKIKHFLEVLVDVKLKLIQLFDRMLIVFEAVDTHTRCTTLLLH